ncbi:hypothetical protein OF83DRAFT_1175845 [Amylostereum chailletii]|nr:hypothetical protein OF83DRAFT_1175845 [Amylostereum chailletii]
MAKPTLFQVLLNKPSQTYHFPNDKNYHSAKSDFVKAARPRAERAEAPLPPLPPAPVPAPTLIRQERLQLHSHGVIPLSSPSPSRPDTVYFDPELDLPDAFSIPSASTHSSADTPPRVQLVKNNGDRDPDRGEEDEDVFYTPLSTPLPSPASSMYIDPRLIATLIPLPDKLKTHLKAAAALQHHLPQHPPAEGSSSSVNSATSSTTPTTSEDTLSLFSDVAPSEETQPSSVVHSFEAILPNGSSSLGSQHGRHIRRSLSTAPRPKSHTYTDEDWAKDVRWLVAPSATTAKPHSAHKPHRRQPSHPPVTEYVDLPLPSLPNNEPPSASRRRAKPGRSALRKDRMSALWEEDEDGEQNHVGNSLARTVSTSGTGVARSNSVSSTRTATTANTTARSKSSRSHSRSASLTSHSSATSSHASPRTLVVTAPPPPVPSSVTSSHSYISSGTTATTSAVIGGLGGAGYTSLTPPRAGYTPADPRRTLAGGRIDLARDGRAQVTMATVEVVRGVAEATTGLLGGKAKGGLLTRRLSTAKKAETKASKRTAAEGPDLVSSLALTSHRNTPTYVPDSHVLVQVYAVALDGLDKRLAVEGTAGFVPGRCVVGRVIEAGVEVIGEEGRRGEWVVGLADVRKCGGLAEFILLDRHQIHRVPQPILPVQSLFPPSRTSSPLPSTIAPPRSRRSSSSSVRSLLTGPSLGALSLLPLAVSAFRAIRTFTPPSQPNNVPSSPYSPYSPYDHSKSSPHLRTSPNSQSPAPNSPLSFHSRSSSAPGYFDRPIQVQTEDDPPCALILQGQSGAGALAVLLVRELLPQVRVLVHIEPKVLGVDALPKPVVLALNSELDIGGLALDAYAENILSRLKGWGVTAVCIGTAIETLDMLALGNFNTVDFVLDTIGGRAVWEAGERLLACPSTPFDRTRKDRTRGEAQFTTLVGDTARAVPGAQDHWRASRGPKSAVKTKEKRRRRVRWAWVPCSSDVDMEGRDVRENLAAVIRALGVFEAKPAWRNVEQLVSDAVLFERAMDVFGGVCADNGMLGMLDAGGCAVVKVGT